MKPGYLTTEFWTTNLLHFMSTATIILAATGTHFDGAKLQPLIPAAALIASGIAQIAYSISRGRVKSAALYSAPTPNAVTVPDTAPVAAVTVPPFLAT